ncbi:MAG: hypothetical protein KF809_12815 [Chloroflexi bacterium]|nr:hypothetical protein [Chloroflexota bacterium]
MTPIPPSRVAWFADLEAVADRIEVLGELRDEIGLTTLVPESHISHTSAFRASAAVAASGPFEAWRDQPGLADHRAGFGVAEPAMAVLPGIVGGVDDAPLLRIIEECRRLGIEVWGHAGVWCYGAEVFPEHAAVDLLGRPLLPGSLPWGTMFCPSAPAPRAWIAASLADAAGRYDLDGWFLDHARYPSPGFAPALLACGCGDCEVAGRELGVSFGTCREDLLRLAAALGRSDPDHLDALAAAGPAAVLAWLDRWPGVLAWLEVRAAILALRFGELGAAVQAASPRPVDFGSDVFPPSVALLGGQRYDRWTTTATYLTGGFGPRIGWGSVGRVTVESLGPALAALVPGMTMEAGMRVVAALVGARAEPDPTTDDDAFVDQVRAMALARGGVPAYPPIAGPPEPARLARMCRAIVDAGLPGAMLAGLERTSPEQRRVIRTELTERLA